MDSGISYDAWLAELEGLGAFESDEGMTVDEMSEQWGKCPEWIRKRLRKAMTLGILKRGQRQSTRIDGKPMSVPVYRLIKEDINANPAQT